MKFLAFVDLHYDYELLLGLIEKVETLDPDFIICAGDFTFFGEGGDELLDLFNSFGKDVYLIHGNHESLRETKNICASFDNIKFVHKSIVDISGVTFVFFGGGGFEERESGFVKLIDKNKEKLEGSGEIVLVTHAPPKDTVVDDLGDGTHVGVIDYKEFILDYSPIYSISGHIHESAKCMETIGDTVVINPAGNGELIKIKSTKS